VRSRLLYLGLGTAATLALHFLVGLPWGWATLASFVGWPIVGTIITIDDDLRGGWSNPDGTRRPDWLQAGFWAHILSGVAIAAIVGVFDSKSLRDAALLAAAAIVAGGVSAILIKRAVSNQEKR
jgi:hypothetical protein